MNAKLVARSVRISVSQARAIRITWNVIKSASTSKYNRTDEDDSNRNIRCHAGLPHAVSHGATHLCAHNSVQPCSRSTRAPFQCTRHKLHIPSERTFISQDLRACLPANYSALLVRGVKTNSNTLRNWRVKWGIFVFPQFQMDEYDSRENINLLKVLLFETIC